MKTVKKTGFRSQLAKRLKAYYGAYDRYCKQHVLLSVFIKFVVIFGAFYLIGLHKLDSDFGWHLQAGDYIRAHGIPRHDIYTYTAQTYHWVDHEWANDVVLSVVYGLGGYKLAAVLYGLIWTGALMTLASRARLLSLLLAMLALLPYAGVRPLAYSAFFLSLSIWLVSRPNKRWFLPLLFIVWSNFHAGFISGFAIIAYYALKELDKKLATILVVCGFATLVNAYGFGLYIEIAHTVFDPAIHSQIAEWARFVVPPASAAFLLTWLGGFIVYEKTRFSRFLQLGPLLLVSALSATRNFPFFTIATTMQLDGYITDAKKSFAVLDRPRKLLLAAIAAILVAFAISGSFYFTHLLSQDRLAGYPTQAVAYLQTHTCQGNLFNDYNYGGFLIWQLPDQPVYIDGRMVTWRYYMNRYEAVINDPAHNYQAQFKQYNIRCVLLADSVANRQLLLLLQQNKWRPVVEDSSSTLLLAP